MSSSFKPSSIPGVSETLFANCNETAAHFLQKRPFCFGPLSFRILGRGALSPRKVRVGVSIVLLLLNISKGQNNFNTHFASFIATFILYYERIFGFFASIQGIYSEEGTRLS
jgi:hypothetical protein